MEFTAVDVDALRRIGAKRYKIWCIMHDDGEHIDTGKTVAALSHAGALRKVANHIFPLPWFGCKYAVSEIIEREQENGDKNETEHIV